jgi:glycosyltransferase involved in cell wall biosynthesis
MNDLREVFRDERIQLVHSHEFEMAVYGAAVSRQQRIPHLFTMHGGLTVWKAWQRRVALRWAARSSAASVVVSAATREQFARELRIPRERFHVIPNGVPIRVGNADRVRTEFRCASDDLVLLAVGNLERNKGHEELLGALFEISRRAAVLKWKLIIAGGRGGPEHDRLLRLVRDYGLTARVHITTDRNDIPDLQALADVFVMPSLWEGMPMALLEGMVAGNAIVASKTGGIPEAIRHNKEGLLTPPGDVNALADAIELLLRNDDYRNSIASAARLRASVEFTVQAMTARYEDLYREVLSRQR